MAGLITVADLVARPGFADIDPVEAQSLIDDASAVVRLAAQGLLDDVESPAAPPYIVKTVVTLIRRGWQNPNGHQSEQLGDYSYSAGTVGGVATMELTAREKKNVRRAVGASGVGSVTLEGDLPYQPSDSFCGTGESLLGS